MCVLTVRSDTYGYKIGVRDAASPHGPHFGVSEVDEGPGLDLERAGLPFRSTELRIGQTSQSPRGCYPNRRRSC